MGESCGHSRVQFTLLYLIWNNDLRQEGQKEGLYGAVPRVSQKRDLQWLWLTWSPGQSGIGDSWDLLG